MPSSSSSSTTNVNSEMKTSSPLKRPNGSHFNKQQQYPLQNEISSWLQNLILQQDDKDMNEKETLMNILQHHFQGCDDADNKLVEDFANAILSCRIRRVNYHKRKAMSEKDQQEPITPLLPQPSGRNNNNSTTKKNKGEGSINDALNSDETFFSPSSAVSAKSSVRSDNDNPEFLFYRRLNVTNANKENNGISSKSPVLPEKQHQNTRTSPNIDNQDTNYTSPTTRDEATNDISMPDLSNLKFDIDKADKRSNNNSNLRKPTQQNQKIHSQPKDQNKQKGDDLQNDNNAEAIFPPQPPPTPPFASNRRYDYMYSFLYKDD